MLMLNKRLSWNHFEKKSYSIEPSVVLASIAFLLRKRKKRISSCRVARKLHSGLRPVTRVREQKEMTMAKKYKLDDYDVRIIVRALIDLRNKLIGEGRYTDSVDEILLNYANRNVHMTSLNCQSGYTRL